MADSLKGTGCVVSIVTDADGQIRGSTDGTIGACDQIGAVDPFGEPICSTSCPKPAFMKRVGFARGLPVRLSCMNLNSGDRVVVMEVLPLPPEPIVTLSSRELEVLSLSAEGYTDQDIARILGIGSGTIRTHMRHVRGKLNARSRTEAVARALNLGLFSES